ncbi:AAA family ATPase [Cohnella massiliensis]|uniref:AAA family ATPase n=1 Tax=Cohnella massiliensis TaxID=1816691 RepID=UPI0009BBA6A9
MNLSARLMQLAPAGTVLCDSATCEAAGPAIRFQAAETVHPKGMPGPIKVYSPLGLADPQGAERRTLVGRTAETALLERHLERLLQGEGGVVCLMGEAGIGKSLLLRQAQLEAEGRGATVLYGEADAIEQRTPYYPWRSLFVTLLRLAAAPEGSELRYEQALRIIHEATEDSRHLVPLLSEVLPFEIPDNEWTRQMTGQIRADNLHALVIRLMKRFMGDAPFVLMLDDAHWIDSSTWALLFAVSQQLPQALLLVASRPDGEHQHLRDLPLLKLPSATVIRLGELSPDETFELIANRLGVSRLSEAVGSFISEKAEGHPFFIEELAYALRDSGFIEIENGECRFARQTDDLRELDFPTTIQGIIRSRIDRLPADEQLVLKVASVIGRAFPYYALHGTMPMPTEHDRLEGHLDRLTEASLTLREEAETEPSYLFKHVITQQVSYNMLVHSQRKQLHRALAVWYEKRHADASSLYGVLAYHWSRAEQPDKTVYYLEKVGLQALRTGAYKEAVHVFSELVNGQAVPASAETSARWHRLLGEAYMGIGDMAQASERIGQALTLHGRPAASTSKQFKRDVAAQVVRQLVHRTLPSRFIEKPAGSRELLLGQALCHWRLAEIAFFSNMAADNLYHSLHAINLAERAGPSAELAQISGNMCVTAGIMSLHPLAKAYIKQATQAAERTDDLSAKAWVSMDLSLYYIGIGQWSLSKRYSEQSMGIYEKMGDRRYWEASSYLMVKALAYHDADFGKSSALAEAIYSSGRASGNAQAQSWGLLALAENALYEGRAEDAIRHLTEAEALIPVNIGRTEEIRLYNLSALAYIKTGRAEQAKHYAGLGLPLTTASKPTTYYAFDGYAALVEALLALWNSPGEDRAYYRSSLGEAMKSLEGFAKVFPIALPRFHAFAGIVAGCEGDFGKARKSWSRSLRLARKLAMPYEIGWTEAEIRRFTP